MVMKDKDKLTLSGNNPNNKAASLIVKLIEHANNLEADDLRSAQIDLNRNEEKSFNIAFFDNLKKHTEDEFKNPYGNGLDGISENDLPKDAVYQCDESNKVATLKYINITYNIYPITVGNQTLRDFLGELEQSNGKEIPESFKVKVQKFEGKNDWDKEHVDVKFDMAFCDVEETLSFNLKQLHEALGNKEKFESLFGNDLSEDLFKDGKTDLDRFNKIKKEGLLKTLMYKEMFDKIKKMKGGGCELSILSSAFDVYGMTYLNSINTIDTALASAIKESLLDLYCKEFNQEQIEVITEDGKCETATKNNELGADEVEFSNINIGQSKILPQNLNPKKENQPRAKSLNTVTEYIDAIIELEKTISSKVTKDEYHKQYLSDLESLKKNKRRCK